MAQFTKQGDPKPIALRSVSRTKIDLFCQCPRCFYLDQIGGIGRPSIPSFTLNNAVDGLLKREFDVYREKQEAHPLMMQYGIQALPFQHPDLEKWRNNKIGVRINHYATELLIFGAIDDIWVDKDGILYVVEYKATSTKATPSLDGRAGYKRQVEIYQWLLRQNGYRVSNTSYFVFCNGIKERDSFDARLDFGIEILPYEGSSDWLEDTLSKIRKCLDSESIPPPAEECEHCSKRASIREFEEWHKNHLADLMAKKSKILESIDRDYMGHPALVENFNRFFMLLLEESRDTHGTFNASMLFDAIDFALAKHWGQQRKTSSNGPYMLHPLAVTEILWIDGKIRDPEILAAGILHDTLEDTGATIAEIQGMFGTNVANIIQELTDDPNLSSEENKQRQVEKAGTMSAAASAVKLADRTHNLREIKIDPPMAWKPEKIAGYVEWSNKLLKAFKGANKPLESALRKAINELSN